MLMAKDRRPRVRTMRGWAIHELQEAGAIRECEEHGWMQERADPHARERAFDIARENPPAGISTEAAVAEVRDGLDTIGDACPECPPEKKEPAPGTIPPARLRGPLPCSACRNFPDQRKVWAQKWRALPSGRRRRDRR